MAKPIELEINGNDIRELPCGHASSLCPARRARPDRSKVRLRGRAMRRCTVLIGGMPRRSCQIPVSAAAAKPITTMKVLKRTAGESVQQAFSMRVHSSVAYSIQE